VALLNQQQSESIKPGSKSTKPVAQMLGHMAY
jgi:hypothetical protein